MLIIFFKEINKYISIYILSKEERPQSGKLIKKTLPINKKHCKKGVYYRVIIFESRN